MVDGTITEWVYERQCTVYHMFSKMKLKVKHFNPFITFSLKRVVTLFGNSCSNVE